MNKSYFLISRMCSLKTAQLVNLSTKSIIMVLLYMFILCLYYVYDVENDSQGPLAMKMRAW